ncbi:MAG: gliding motility-associated C-terminal domain-containing protein [Chitinophagales bacterium]
MMPNPRVMRNVFSCILFFFVVNNLLKAQNCSINAGISATICQNETMTLNGTRSGLLGNGSISKWTQLSGPAVIINSPNSLTTTVTGFSVGTYVFRLSIKCRDGLLAEDFVTITVTPVTIANAGVDTNYCPGNSFLHANSPLNSNEIGVWSIVSTNNAGITIQSPSNPNSPITFNPNLTGTTTLRWTIINNNGCSSFDEIKITNIGGMMPVNAGPDQELGNCFSSTTCTTLAGSNGGNGTNGQTGVWTLVSGPNTPTFTSPNNSTTKVCNLIEGTYVFRYTVQGPCASGFDDVTVLVPPQTQDITLPNSNITGATTSYCGLVNTLTLNGNIPQYTGETVLWTQTAGPPVTINTPNSPSTTVSGLTAYGSYCFNYSIINNSSNCQKSSLICNTLYQAGTLNAGTDQILPCNVTTATINITKTGSGILNYRIISGPSGVFTYPTSFKPSNIITGMTNPGTYRVEVNYSFGLGCPSVSDYVDITVSRPPTGANAGSDQNFACTSVTTQLAGNNPSQTGLGTGSWSQIAGPNIATLVPVTNYVCNVIGTIPGLYTFRWTIRGGNNCPENFDDMNVIIPDTSLTTSDAGADRIVCSNSPITLHGNDFRIDETAKWTAIPNNVTFSPSNTVSNPVASGLSANTAYKFIYTISNTCDYVSTDTVIITTSSSAGPSIASAGPDQCLPSGTSLINLNAVRPVSGAGVWKQVSGNIVTITDSLLNNTTVTNVQNGTYKFVWTVSVDGCNNASTDTIVIVISGTTTIANAGVDATLCANSYTLNANTPIFGTGRWTQISGDGNAVIVSPSNPTTLVNNLITGIYTFRWTISNSTCSSNYDDVIITISSPPTVANAGNDQTLCGINAGTTVLNASIPSFGTGQWVQVRGPNTAVIANRTLMNTGISGLTNGIYTFKWIVTGGPNCPQTSDEVLINVNLPANAGADQSLCNLTSTTLTGNSGSSGIWSQLSGPSVNIIQTPVGNPIANITGLTQGSSYVFRYTIPSIFGCPATFDDVIVNNGITTFVPDAGNDTSFCNVTSFALSGSLPSSGETGTWSVLSGPTGYSFSPNPNTPNAILLNASPGQYVLRWTISNTNCSSSDIKNVFNYALPSAANAGADQNVCFESATLRGNTPFVGIGTWTQITGPSIATIAAKNNPVTSVSGLNAVGTYKFTWTITNGGACNSNKDTVSFVVSELSPSIANAGTDKIMCSQSSVVLNANTPSSGTGAWSKVGTSSAIIVTPLSPSTLINTLSPGLHRFVWTIRNADNSCSSSDTVSVINSVIANNANAGADDTFCVFNTILLSANTPISGTTGKWSFVSGPTVPAFLTPDNPQCQLTGVIPGNYKFLWTISSPSCTPSSDEVVITVIANADLAIAGANQTLCATSANLDANLPTGNNKGIWSQYEGPSDAVFLSIEKPNTSISNLIPGTYRFTWKIYNQRCFTTDTVTYIIYKPASVNAGNDISVCNRNTQIPLSSATVNSTDSLGVWSLISGAGLLNNTAPTTKPDTVNFVPATDYYGTVVLRLSAQDMCHVVYDDINILLKEPIIPIAAVNDYVTANPGATEIINVLLNDTIYVDDTLNFCPQNAIVTPPLHGTVTINADATIAYQPFNNYFTLDSFQYQICVQESSDSNWNKNCYKEGVESAWVFISMNNDGCIIPNAFSPNDDGINDVFKIECGTDLHLSVYNNWGIELFRDDDYQNNWGGTYNGAPIPDGTYFYSLKYLSKSNETISKAGFICLHR